MPVPDCTCPGHPAPEDEWRHVVSEVAPGLFVTGEPLSGDPGPLRRWERLGVETVLDLTDRGRPLAKPSTVRRVWLPTPDDGSLRDPAWMASVAREAAHGERVLVHCHMGVARAPSAAFLLMLQRGHDELSAIEAVLSARPIAAANYAADVLRWHLGGDAGADDRVSALEARRRSLVAVHRERLLREAAG